MRIFVFVETGWSIKGFKEKARKTVVRNRKPLKKAIKALGCADLAALMVLGCIVEALPAEAFLISAAAIAAAAAALALSYRALGKTVEKDREAVIRKYLR